MSIGIPEILKYLMKRIKISTSVSCISLYFCGLFFLAAQQTPADKQSVPIAIENVTAHIGNGDVVQEATIVFTDGKITAVGKNVTVPTGATYIDGKGQHAYPGLIAPNTTLGLVEIDAIRPSNDIREIGSYNPHIRSIIAYNAESKLVETSRPSGVLIAQTTPRSGTISGSSSVVQLDAWNWEDAVIKADDGIHINWPQYFSYGDWWLNEDRLLSRNKKYTEQVQALLRFVKEAKAYTQEPDEEVNLPYRAIKGIFDGNQKLFIHVAPEKAIRDVLQFVKEEALSNVVLTNAYEAFRVIPELKEMNLPVLTNRVHSLPWYEDDDYDQSYKNAVLLYKAGILVGLQNSGSMERANVRNLPFQAGTTAAHGLTPEEALQLITLNNAKILGIDNQLGTLEVGKDATLFLSQGDALDMRTNQLTQAYIQGRKLNLDSHHTNLWKRYSEKFKNSGKP